ncbi:hypothetical protein BX666DRAFT_2029684 [Dichotomocladium elegans]|nr:hypothetical protein BX666DRAFT_2029684 [Dichotomocladium elegans]
MSTRTEIEEAIQLMQEMGIARKQAVKALSRYNYDVGRAADYIFSGNADTDSGSDTDAAGGRATTSPTSVPTGERSSSSTWDKDQESLSFGSAETTNTPNSVTDSPELKSINASPPPAPVELVKDYGKQRDHSTVDYDPALWSVVPVSSSTRQTDMVTQPAGSTAAVDTTSKALDRNSLTWWHDPYNPSERARKSGICVGLRPPPYDSAYVPAVVQALYHISVFQYAVLTYQPLPIHWGSPRGFWCGEGEPVSGISAIREERVIPNIPLVDSENTTESIVGPHNDIQESDVDSVWEDDGMNSSTSSHQIEMRVLPKNVQALSELQKIFGFLRNTKRQYGDVHTFMFLDGRAVPGMAIGYKLAKAQDDYGDEIDYHELYYLLLKYDANARTFHDCLTPWVYNGRKKHDTPIGDDSSISSGCTASEVKRRLTTFEVVPPILIVTLADKNDDPNRLNVNKYQADKTIYMDRYLHENKDEALKRYEQADEWRYEIREAKAEISKLSFNNVHDCRGHHAKASMDKRELLKKTMEYFRHNTFDDIDGATLESLQSVLSSVDEDITHRLEELHEIEEYRQQSLKYLFDTPDLQKRPYDIRALLHSDGGNGPGHHWAYIWVEQGNLPADSVPVEEDDLLEDGGSTPEGQWFRFFDAIVTPVTEAEVFDEPTSPFAVIYVDRGIKTLSNNDLDAAVPPGLRANNASFEKDIKYFGGVNNVDSSDDDARIADAFQTDDDDDDDSDTFHEADSLDTIGSNEVQVADNSRIDEGVRCGGDTVEAHVKEYDADDYRLIQDFANFLRNIDCTSAIDLYNTVYVVEEKDNVASAEISSRRDPELAPLWFEYDNLVNVARTVTNGLIAFTEERYSDAVMWFLEAKKEEASWKQHLAVDTLLLDDHPRLMSIGFGGLTSVFGKACVEILESSAYRKASDPAYCVRGLQEAITIAHVAQAIIGPDKIANDPVFNEMRERWLRFSETHGSILQGGQAELLDSLIMAFLESEDSGDDTTMSPPKEALNPVPETGPLLAPVYRQARLDAGTHLAKLDDIFEK